MEENVNMKKKVAKKIHEAAEHAGNTEYKPALEQINEAIKEINGIFPVTCEELEKVRKLIEMYLNSDEEKEGFTEEEFYWHLDSIAEDLESTI